MTDGILSTIENWTGRRPTTCPWMAFSEPIVVRTLNAFSYYDKGQLDTYAPDASNRLIEAVSLYARATAMVSSKRMRLEREEMRNERHAREAHARG